MATKNVVTGVDYAFVNAKDGQVHEVHEGDEIPPCTPVEQKRLADLGVFGVHPRDSKAAAENKALVDALRGMGLERSAEEVNAHLDLSRDDEDGGGDPLEHPSPPAVLPGA